MRRAVVLVVGLMVFQATSASAAPDVVRQGTCSGGARSQLELTHLGPAPSPPFHNRIRVRFEVHRSPVRHEWRITLRTGQGVGFFYPPLRLVFRGIRVASDSGDLVVRDRVPEERNVDRRNLFRAKAVDTQTGQICEVNATIH
jgi:hypothetical protein